MAAQLPRTLWRQLMLSPARQIVRSTSSSKLPITAFSVARAAAYSTRPSIIASSTRAFPRFQPRRQPYSSQPPKDNKVKFWPFVLIIALGSGGYVLLANQRVAERDATMPTLGKNAETLWQLPERLPAPAKPTPTFSPRDVTVVFVLGGPGAGKGTQCARLVSDYGFTHLSAGDLLRAEQDRPGSEFGELIKQCIRDGAIVPMEVTVQLLENAMTEQIGRDKREGTAKTSKFLIDGFPRKMDQAVAFEKSVCPARFVLFYDCPEDEMQRRLMHRGETSGRADDNAASIQKRFRTFVETSMPVVKAYEKEGKVIIVDARPKPEDVYRETKRRLEERLGKDL